MSEISNFPPSPVPPRTEIREIQPATAGAQLSQVEEDVFNENANAPATSHRAATGTLGRPPIGFVSRSTPSFGRGQHTELLQAQRNAFAQHTAPINQHSEFIQAQRNAYGQYSAPINQVQNEDPFEGSVYSYDNRESVSSWLPDCFGDVCDQAWAGFASPAQYPGNANNLSRADYMQVSHIQEVVRQNESASYYLEASAATLPSDSDAAANLDLVTRGKLDAHDAYDAASAAFVDKFMHDNYFTSLDDIGQAIDALNALEDLYVLATGDPDKPTDEPAPVRRSHLNGATVGDTKDGHHSNAATTPAAAGSQTANRPRRQPVGASAGPNPPHAGRGGSPDGA
jgi:hypothetical protein